MTSFRSSLCRAIAALVLVVCLTGCVNVRNFIEKRRHAQAERVAADLKQHRRQSVYYRKSAKREEVGSGVSVLTVSPWRVYYYGWPLGPWSVLDVETGQWTFEE